MKRLFAAVVLVLGLALTGCGGDTGPAPTQAPTMTDEQVREEIQQSMPPDALKSMPPQARKQYEQYLQGGGTPGK